MQQTNINTMTQEQKDLLLEQLLAKAQREAAVAEAKLLGLSWSKNGFISVRLGKIGDKAQPALYIHPSNINELQNKMAAIVAFATDAKV